VQISARGKEALNFRAPHLFTFSELKTVNLFDENEKNINIFHYSVNSSHPKGIVQTFDMITIWSFPSGKTQFNPIWLGLLIELSNE
jgi:hypothetical protein